MNRGTAQPCTQCQTYFGLGGLLVQGAAQPPKQHIVRRLVLGMVLEACALEPLHDHRLASLDRLLLWLTDRHAKQCQALGEAAAPPAVELQPMSLPVGLECPAQAVSGLCEIAAASGGACDGWKCLPVTPLRLERLDAQTAKQHIVRRLVLWMILEACALEYLGQRCSSLC